MNHSGLVAIALASALGCASPANAAAQYWTVCRAQAPVKDGTVIAVQTEPFDVGAGGLEKRLFEHRTFEAALRAQGATGLKDAMVACTPTTHQRGDMPRLAQALRDQGIAANPPGTKVVEGPWPSPFKPGAFVPEVLVAGGELASPTTRASSPQKWGLTAPDFSLLHDRALLAKAGLPGRKAELQAAAAQGDAYAQFLLSKRVDQDDDRVMLQKAASQGLVRAIVDFQLPLAFAGATNVMPHLEELHEMAQRGSAHAKYVAGRAILSHKQIPQEMYMIAARYLQEADQMGYAPAQLWTANDLRNSKNESVWRQGRERARLAAAQGLPEAREFLEKNPARWPEKR